MFRCIDPHNSATVTIEIDGEAHSVPAQLSVAAAILYLNQSPLRVHPVDVSARMPHCMMGMCFECLVEIDGNPNQRSCQVEVVQGMRISRSLQQEIDEGRD